MVCGVCIWIKNCYCAIPNSATYTWSIKTNEVEMKRDLLYDVHAHIADVFFFIRTLTGEGILWFPCVTSGVNVSTYV